MVLVSKLQVMTLLEEIVMQEPVSSKMQKNRMRYKRHGEFRHVGNTFTFVWKIGFCRKLTIHLFKSFEFQEDRIRVIASRFGASDELNIDFALSKTFYNRLEKLTEDCVTATEQKEILAQLKALGKGKV